jgi:beta-glucanase (GH16 family)
MRRPALLAALSLAGIAACSAAPAAPSPAAPAPVTSPGGDPLPLGQRGGWTLAFSDEFDGSALDTSRWNDHSSAEPDEGRGNHDNQQLEWNQAANCTVSGGSLTMTARREHVISPSSGQDYDWTSCLITTRSSDAFQYGYLEERSILPAATGFWPAFWTWQARGTDQQIETDVYEFYSDNHTRLYSTQYSGAGGRCDWTPPFDPSAGWHTYGVALEPTGTTWYADGRQVCHTDATSAGPTTVISNLAVYSKIPPAASTSSAVKKVDYLREWFLAKD